MTNREQELWALALYVERRHGADGPKHIAEKIGAAVLAGEEDAALMWKKVASRYAELMAKNDNQIS